ncbi:MAG: prohibitin family protein [Thermoflexibacteraceae bacterium]|jgi:regulator of protease activity HflC (stomatin/prohibitin superfamily)
MKKAIIVCLFTTLLSSCAIVRQDEVGVKRRLGKLVPKVLPPGIYFRNSFTTKMLRIPTRTLSMQMELDALPSKEGLSIGAEMAILYHVKPEKAIDILQAVGKIRNGEQIIMSVLRSASADVTSKFYAKDMHTSEREQIEKAIATKMMDILGDRGFVIENVLLKSIRLPEKLSRAIEEKLKAEQEAQRMEFVLNQERKEAERKRIEAEGVRDAQKIIGEGLTPLLIQFKSLETFQKLSNSNNTKVIITDGKMPLLIDNNVK